MLWKPIWVRDPWQEDTPSGRPIGTRWAVVVAAVPAVFFGSVGAVIIAPHAVARLVTDCPTKGDAVASAARSLGASHVTGTRYIQADDGSWVARFYGVANEKVIHARTTAEFHHHWYADCYKAVGTTIGP